MAVDPALAKSIFLAASELPDSAERADYLHRECAGNEELRARVEALLRVNDAMPLPPDEATAVRLRKVSAPCTKTEDYGDLNAVAGALIAGKYKLLQQIGEGGMGTVWMADQTEPVKRRVAVKLIRTERGQSKTIPLRTAHRYHTSLPRDHQEGRDGRDVAVGARDGGPRAEFAPQFERWETDNRCQSPDGAC